MGGEMKVYRNSKGVVRNIGEWDFLVGTDDDGNEFIRNPIPDTYTVSEEEVVTGWDDGLYVVGDPRAEGN